MKAHASASALPQLFHVLIHHFMITKNTSFSLRGILLDFNCEATLLLELLQLHARIFETKLARL